MEDLELYSSVLFDRQGECWAPKTKGLGKKNFKDLSPVQLEDLVNSETSMLIWLFLPSNQYLVSLAGLLFKIIHN